MNCNNCPDREVCYRFGTASQASRDFQKLKESYLRTLRCRSQRFG